MSKTCSICGRGTQSANNVSHSNVKTKTTQSVNIQKKTIGGLKVKACAKCIKTAARTK